MQVERAISSHVDHEGNPSHGVDIRITGITPPGTITLWGLFDVHWDSTDCATHKLKSDIKKILADPYARVIIGGDFNNMIFERDPRYVPAGLAARLQGKGNKANHIVEWNMEILDQLRDRIDLYISGNHEETFDKQHESNVAEQTAKLLGVPYFSYYALIRYHMRKKNGAGRITRGWVHHGFGGNAPVTAGAIPLSRVAAQNRFDWTTLGHLHQRTFREPAVFDDSGAFGSARLMEIPIAQAQCGTFSRNYSGAKASWSAQKGHPPARLGAARMYLDYDYVRDDGLIITPRVN